MVFNKTFTFQAHFSEGWPIEKMFFFCALAPFCLVVPLVLATGSAEPQGRPQKITIPYLKMDCAVPFCSLSARFLLAFCPLRGGRCAPPRAGASRLPPPGGWGWAPLPWLGPWVPPCGLVRTITIDAQNSEQKSILK